jgi:hypothetical protein
MEQPLEMEILLKSSVMKIMQLEIFTLGIKTHLFRGRVSKYSPLEGIL